jgi:hypothetical protein
MKFGRNQPRSQPIVRVARLAGRVRNSWLCFIPGTPLHSSSVSSDTAAVMAADKEQAEGGCSAPLGRSGCRVGGRQRRRCHYEPLIVMSSNGAV